MANPALAPKRIEETLEELEPGWAAPRGPGGAGATATTGLEGTPPTTRAVGATMTAGGTFAKTFGLWVLIVAGGAYGWSQTKTTQFGNVQIPGWTIVAMLVALAFAMVTIFKPKVAPFTTPLYAIAEGIALGAISKAYDAAWSGIVLQAVLATVGTFVACLLLYSFDIVKVTDKFRTVVITATVGIFVMYALTMLLNLFGVDMEFWAHPSAVGIGISVVICIVAALNLFVDFAVIDQGIGAGAPTFMEWYSAWGLLATVVWLYLEVLY
ncbi:MAG: Bax inhibitor-1/YccA family protein, partial [Acidimicrobiia bacterium]